MKSFNKIVLASNNDGKLKEFKSLFKSFDLNLISQKELNVPDVDEPFHTFVENALHKARHTSQFTGLPALADDSGLIVPALNGAPGVYSARYATEFGLEKSDQNNNEALIKALKNIEDKSAAYIAVLVLLRHPHDPAPIIAQALWHGRIVEKAQGQNGFGYDPHFYLDEYQQTAAEMSPDLKNSISHRAMAFEKLLEEFK